MLQQVSDKTDEPIDTPFTTERKSPFAGFNPDLKQIGVFINRFFNKWSYEDLAQEGIIPIVFAQPWNRQPHPLLEVSRWPELASLLFEEDEGRG